jgi:trimeric autotransporter adhesin
MKKLLLTLFLGGLFCVGRSQEFSLLKDINPGSGSSNICYLTNVDNMMFFAATDGVNGMELWKSDGTEVGTVMVKDIRPGSSNSSIGYLTHVNHVLYFVANNGTTGTELWKSDGTAAGTVLVKDIRTGTMGSNPSGLVNLNGILYFAADDGINGSELWKSDGTASGTVMVKDINPFSEGSYPQYLANANGALYFAADNGVTGMELWKSDGTAPGTVLVKDILLGPDGSFPYGLTGIGNALFFAATDGIKGTELWKSDGTIVGTTLLKDIWTGSSESYPFSFKSVNGQLFFSANNGTKGDELWKSDGTTAGTLLVKDIWPGVPSGAAGNFSSFLSKLLFTGNDGVTGYTTWESDGTAAGTVVATIGSAGDMHELVETDDNIYASIRQTDIGRELWAISFSSVLPLRFLEFKGFLAGGDAILNWKTDHEVNTSEFIIERSFDGNTYSPAGHVKSANTPGIHSYAFTDFNAASGAVDVIYYRIKQKDIDGRSTHSKVISLSPPALVNSVSVKAYPNPATNHVTLSVNFQRKDNLNYSIFDNAGRKLMHHTAQVPAGLSSLPVDINKLPSGIYYLKISSDSVNEKLQFVKR